MRLGDLKDWAKNPRQLSEHDAKHITKSIELFGLADPLVVNVDGSLIGGHQRKRVMLADGSTPDTLVDVRIPSRQLTEREAEELAIRLNKNSGDWDFDKLANEFEVPDLLDWGFLERELGLDNPIDFNKEWEGMPEYDNSARAIKTLYVHFETEDDVKDFSNLIGQKVDDKTKYIWYPEHRRRDLKSLEFMNES
jgi:hypothetical protein